MFHQSPREQSHPSSRILSVLFQAWKSILTLKFSKILKIIKSQKIGKPKPARRTGKYILRLFIAGATDRSRQAILRVQLLCREELKNKCILEVIDIYQQPHLARENQILATPTLIKEFPRPVRRYIGNLTNISRLFPVLDSANQREITV